MMLFFGSWPHQPCQGCSCSQITATPFLLFAIRKIPSFSSRHQKTRRLSFTKSTATIKTLGYLSKIRDLVTENPRQEFHLVPKRSEMMELFKEYHDKKGHPGRDALYKDLKLVYGWSGMKLDVERYNNLKIFRNKNYCSS